MSLVRVLCVAALAFGIALPALLAPAGAQGIPKVQSPEEVGFLSTRLKRLTVKLPRG